MTRLFTALAISAFSAAIVAACGDDDTANPLDGGAADVTVVDASELVDATDAADAGPCGDAGAPASTLECVGLYSDFATKTLAADALPFAPAMPLWSDGAGKQRWIQLPRGTTIDRTDSSEWVFPIGTKLFKEFSYNGHRVETRLFQKVTASYWVHATYAWSADESGTRQSFGETVTLDADAGSWVIPTPEDCDSCHRGRTDRALGFEEVNLGLAGATGLTLAELTRRGLLSPAPALTSLQIGDGTGLDAPALGWLHTNCGVSCHNQNENSLGYGAKMFLRLDPATLDGTRPDPNTWAPLSTTFGIACVSGSVAGQPRITPGDPASSEVVLLISQRGDLQMPPIATRVVDSANVAVLSAWVSQQTADAGADASP